jgi:hypothetical protein
MRRRVESEPVVGAVAELLWRHSAWPRARCAQQAASMATSLLLHPSILSDTQRFENRGMAFCG